MKKILEDKPITQYYQKPTDKNQGQQTANQGQENEKYTKNRHPHIIYKDRIISKKREKQPFRNRSTCQYVSVPSPICSQLQNMKNHRLSLILPHSRYRTMR